MSVANLTRYSLEHVKSDDDEYDVFRVALSGPWVKFEEAVEASSNSLQQLKAEIAALADEVAQMSYVHHTEQDFTGIINGLRQLSAV